MIANYAKLDTEEIDVYYIQYNLIFLIKINKNKNIIDAINKLPTNNYYLEELANKMR